MKNLLYYSNRCKHSNDILKIIQANNLINNFSLIDISQNQVPNYIKSVPSLLIPKGNGEADLLVGSNLFKWINNSFLNKQGSQQQNYIHESNGKKQINHEELNKQAASNLAKNEKKDISDYEPGTMNGFSDNFSFLSDNGPIDHNFSFLGGDNSIPGNKQLPFESKQSDSDVNNPQKKNEMDKAYEQMMSSRTNDAAIPAPITRQ